MHPHWAYLGRQIEEGPIKQAKVVLASTTVIRVTVSTQLDSLITILFEPAHHPDQPPDAIQSDIFTSCTPNSPLFSPLFHFL